MRRTTISINFRIGFWISALLCTALCLYSLSMRVRVESKNKAVSIVVEAEQIEALASSQGNHLESALNVAKENGVNGLVVNEDVVGDLVGSGEVDLSLEALPQSKSPVVHISGSADSIARVERGLRIRFELGADKIGVRVFEENGRSMVDLSVLHLSADLIRSTPVGLDPHYTRAAKLAGLDLVARHANPLGSTPQGLDGTIAWSREEGTEYFLPTGDQVLGRRSNIDLLIEALTKYQIVYASPEFAKIGGDSNMLIGRPENTVRLHAAQANEIDKLTPAGYVERYAKAASERNVRMLLLRPMDYSAEKPFDVFIELIGKVRRQVVKEGAEIRSAHAFLDSEVPAWLFAAIGLSVAPALVYVATALTLRRDLVWAIAILGALLGAASYVSKGRDFTALAGALAFPIAGFLLAAETNMRPWAKFAMCSAFSILGGLVVAALLNELPFFIRADQFSGVKIAVFLPSLVIGLVFFLRLTSAAEAWKSPIVWSQAALGIAIAGMMAFMATRTGNDNPAGVSGLELQVRSLLENLLSVRPRTKEFLIGHPALIVGGSMLYYCLQSEAFRMKWGSWTALALMLGAIGQTSIVNTMCHLHTPVTIGLVRIAIGLAVGSIFGLVAWMLIKHTLLKKDFENMGGASG